MKNDACAPRGCTLKYLSIIIPFFNERENLEPLYNELKQALENLKGLSSWEIVFVNDGSLDGGEKIVEKIVKAERRVRLVSLNRQFGKGKALEEGLKVASGELIAFMDADLQDDPKDLEKFLKKIEQGCDLVNGVRQKRQDNLVIKIYSKIFNWFLRNFLKSPFSDINCGFKVFKREVSENIPLYANNFRFFPLAAFYKGFKVCEVPVNNRPRLHGKSKFGVKKIFIGVLDTLTAYFLFQFAERPLHFFGALGGIIFAIGSIILGYLAIERIFFGQLLYRRPILQLGILLVVIGVQIVMTGFLGELIVYLKRERR